jgi:exopolyphosphatase/guanosine-5'-triphosphate,3'-diphosphate pyrophosphatase
LKLYLVRHAHAQKRATGSGAAFLRPLSARGERQAHGLSLGMQHLPLVQIFSSPQLRCRETVEGLATARGLSVEVDPRLREDASAEEVLDLVRAGSEVPTLICAGGHAIRSLLFALEVGAGDGASLRCQKGSVWVLRGRGLHVDGADYVPPRELARSVTTPRRLAVLDLGSTSFNLVVVDMTADGEIDPILRERSMLRLGAHCVAGGAIPEEDCERALEAVRLMRDEAESVDSEALFPVGTAILRDAGNAAELTQRIQDVLGQPVRLLAGEEEARVSYRALQHRLGVGQEHLLAADLGGGSLELALGAGSRCDWARSLHLGVTRLHAELVRSDRLSAAEQREIRERVRGLVEPCASEVNRRKPLRLIATGGAVRALARLALAGRKQADRQGVKGLVVARPELEDLCQQLVRSSRTMRLAMPTVQERRVDLLPTAALIMTTLLEVLDLEELVVSDWGLREGIVLEALGAGP